MNVAILKWVHEIELLKNLQTNKYIKYLELADFQSLFQRKTLQLKSNYEIHPLCEEEE